MTSLISGHKTEIRKSQSERQPPRVISDFFAKARKVFNKGHGEIISKESSVSPPPICLPVYFAPLQRKADLNTHTRTKGNNNQRGEKKKKKKEPEILVTPHVVFICEK